MKRKLRLNKYFLDPENDSCDELIKQVRVLDESIKKLGKANQARIPGVVSEKYEDYLDKSSIPETNQDPEDVMKDISKLFRGAVRWHHPGTMINITPPPLRVLRGEKQRQIVDSTRCAKYRRRSDHAFSGRYSSN